MHPRRGAGIRVVRLPAIWSSPGYQVHPETRRLLIWLLKSGRRLTIDKVDEYGYVWVKFARREEGRRIWESIALDPGTWERYE